MDRETALRELSQGGSSERQVAARELGRWNDTQVLTALVDALAGDRDYQVRESVADTLEEIGDSRAVRLMLPLLKSDDPRTRNMARGALGRIGAAAPELLFEASKDADPRMRIFVANIMGGTGDHEMAPRLIEMSRDADENVRDAAVVALGVLGAPEAVGALSRFLKGNHSWLQFSALDALSKIGSSEAAAAVLAALPGAGPDMLPAFVDALGRMGAPECLEPLVRLLAGAPELRPTAVRLFLGPLLEPLRDCRDPAIVKSVLDAIAQEILGGKLGEAKAARGVHTLGLLGGPENGPAILKALESADPTMRREAVIAAGRLKLRGAVPLLQMMEKGADATLALEIRRSLEGIGK